MKDIKKEIMKKFEENGRVEIYSSIVDHYKNGKYFIPKVWGEDFFIKVLPNPGGNRIFFHFGRRLYKGVGKSWKIYDSYYTLKNKEINSAKELEFLLNSEKFTEFANSVNWD